MSVLSKIRNNINQFAGSFKNDSHFVGGNGNFQDIAPKNEHGQTLETYDLSSAPENSFYGSNGTRYPYYSGGYNNLTVFDGEKTPYELGTPSDFVLDYYSLRARSWEAFIKSDVIQNAIRKYILWIMGSGLKLSYEPDIDVLKSTEVDISDGEMAKLLLNTEKYFKLYSNSSLSSYDGEMNLHKIGIETLKNALISGDVLIIERFIDGKITTQIVDGVFIETPLGDDFEKKAVKNGNTIYKGVETDKTGKHVAYYVRTDDDNYDIVKAYSKNGKRRQAWLMYGLRHKINDTRGMSLLTAVLETAAKMDRYKEATIGSAEENNKVPYTIEHNQFSDGENPLLMQTLQSMGKNRGTAPETTGYVEGEKVASKIAVTTQKQTYNMPVGSKLMRNNFQSDPKFKEFFEVNTDIVYATLGIPPEIALDRFGGSYSSSRAALKSWEHKMRTDRVNTMTEEFYKPIFRYWFDISVLQGIINAPGYLGFLNTNSTNNKNRYLDFYAKEAYLNCRFIGVNIPHIDPLKEIKAIREKLGKKYENIPLETGDQAVEEIGTGDFTQNIKKAENEIEIASSFIDSPDDGNDNEQEGDQSSVRDTGGDGAR